MINDLINIAEHLSVEEVSSTMLQLQLPSITPTLLRNPLSRSALHLQYSYYSLLIKFTHNSRLFGNITSFKIYECHCNLRFRIRYITNRYYITTDFHVNLYFYKSGV